MRRVSIICVCVLLAIPSLALAQSPPPFPDFKAKRVKPPQQGQKKRINVQIQAESEQPDSSKEQDSPQINDVGRYDWFWENDLIKDAKPGPARLFLALQVLETTQSDLPVPNYPLSLLAKVVADHGPALLLSTFDSDVSPALVLAVIAVESSGRVDVESPVGAKGLMQLMPATIERFDVSDPFSASDNIKGGVAFLDLLMRNFDGDPFLVLAAYNAGEARVREHGGVPPFAETRDYIPKVLAAYRIARSLCKTPPQLISDGCVFHDLGG